MRCGVACLKPDYIPEYLSKVSQSVSSNNFAVGITTEVDSHYYGEGGHSIQDINHAVPPQGKDVALEPFFINEVKPLLKKHNQ